MLIHKEGHIILLSTLSILIGVIAATHFITNSEIIRMLVYLAAIVFFLLILQFFRNPKRNTPINEKHIIAPADGKVVIIEEVEEPEYFNDKRLMVSIFMSPINVHVNRNPVSGKILYAKYHPGQYLVAWHPKSSTLNERTTIVTETKNGEKVLFRQIAGALARRIVYYVRPNQAVQQGSEFGFIKFGSRIDLYLPLGTKVKVQLNQKVTGGETVIAHFAN